MINFQEYERLMKESQTRTMTGREHSKTAKFVATQPKACPKCGVQVFDPLGFKRVIHNVADCSASPKKDCPVCAGSGRSKNGQNPCHRCKGKGYVGGPSKSPWRKDIGRIGRPEQKEKK